MFPLRVIRAMFCALILPAAIFSGRAAPAGSAALSPSTSSGQGPYRIRDRGWTGLWTVALDEWQRPNQSEPEKIPHTGSLQKLLNDIDAWPSERGAKPQLILYPEGPSTSSGQRSSAGAGRGRDPSSRRILTEQILVELAPETAVATVVQATGASGAVAVEFLPGHYLLRFSGPAGVLGALEGLRRLPGVLSAEPQLARQVAKKLLPNDSLFSRLWHLLNTGQNGGTSGMDLRVTNAWERYQGTGMVIGIVDDGLAYSHPDLAPNYRAELSHDFNDNDNDPAPNPAVDFHGTAVSGLAAARGNNSAGVCGVAFGAELAGIRLVSGPTTDALEAAGILHSNAFIQIKNNSWGTADCPASGTLLAKPGPMLSAALSQGTLAGRQGRGTIYVWAAGNGGDCAEDVNYDGMANSVYVFPIGAVTDQGRHPSYSESGACLIACTPSGSPGRQLLTTTDLPGNDGFNRSGVSGELSDRNYTQTFAGTSAAAPLASGVIALVLQANTNLNWRDVKEVLLRSSTRVQPTDAGWHTNSAGIPHHHQFGGGLLNATAAVQLATNWPGLGPLRTVSLSATGLPRTIPDNEPNGVTFSWTLNNIGYRVEHVTVTLSTTHSAWGDLEATLTSPSGTQSRLAGLHDGNPNYDYDNWTFSSVRHWGEQAEGTWTVRLADVAAQDVGTVDSLQLRIYFTVPDVRLGLTWAGNVANLTLTTRAVGWSYVLESSDDFSNWSPVKTLVIPVTGKAMTTDNSPAPDQKFYRARLLH